MMNLTLATGNPHKVEELRALLAGHAMVSGLSDLPGHERFTEPAEIGRTFEENATIKALSYATQTGRTCMADDSGLEIDALDGRPGVISSHYFCDGRESTLSRHDRDAANNVRVLGELLGVPLELRTARFVCVIVVALPPTADHPARVIATGRGTFEGRIGLEHEVPRGENGFGYDPLFLVAPEFVQTSAELTADEKNRLSHRAKAAAGLRPFLAMPENVRCESSS